MQWWQVPIVMKELSHLEKTWSASDSWWRRLLVWAAAMQKCSIGLLNILDILFIWSSTSPWFGAVGCQKQTSKPGYEKGIGTFLDVFLPSNIFRKWWVLQFPIVRPAKWEANHPTSTILGSQQARGEVLCRRPHGSRGSWGRQSGCREVPQYEPLDLRDWRKCRWTP